MSAGPRFLALVSEWAVMEGGLRPGDVVQKLEASGTDWAGSTQDGFHSEFDCTLYWADKAGDEGGSWVVEGKQLASLWTWVMERA